MRFHHLPRLTLVILTIFFGIALLAPAPFTMLAPSPAQPLFPRLVSYSDTSLTHPARGNFYLLSISVTDPDAYIPGVVYLAGWVKGDVSVIPRSILFPPETNFKKVQAENRKDMKDSQNIAAQVALDYVEEKFPENFTSKTPSYDKIRFDVRRTGGPSAGLVFSLSLIELLTKEDLLKGRKVAATGTISKGGYVGIVGGVQEKLVSVARAGASVVLVPADNCRDISSVPSGLKVMPVTTLDEAVQVLLGEKEPRSCTNLGA